MQTLEQIILEKLDRLESVPDALSTSVGRAQDQIFKDVIKLLQKLSYSGGKIEITKDNLAVVAEIGEKLKTILFNGEYIDAVKTFSGEFNVQANITQSFFKKAFGSYSDNALFKQVLESSQHSAISSLADTAIDANFMQPLKNMLTQSITTGATFSDTVDALETFIKGNSTIEGTLYRYVKQVARDGFTIADRQYTKVVSDSFAPEWYKYAGGTVHFTRPFCLTRHGKFYHKKEVEAWGDLKEWDGKIEGTNRQTIFIYAGGYNCLHSILPVGIGIVPEDVIQRNIRNGNYKPKNKK